MSALFNFKTRRGRGGLVEKVWVQDIVGGPVTVAAILVDMEYRNEMNPAPPEPLSERTPRFRNIHFKNIRTTAPSPLATAIVLNGLPECPLENLSFEGVAIGALHGLAARHVRGVTFSNTSLTGGKSPTIALNDCQDISFRNLSVPADVQPFLRLKGDATSDIRCDVALATRRDEIVLADGARAAAVTFNLR